MLRGTYLLPVKFVPRAYPMPFRFTNTSIKALAPRPARYEVGDTEVRGLRLRVSPDGTRIFYLLYTHLGRKRRFKVGAFGALTVAAARKLARAKLAEVATGTDIQAARKAEREDAERARSRCLGAFLENQYWPYARTHHRAVELAQGIVAREFAHLLDKPLEAITAEVMTSWRNRRLADGLKPSTLNRARAVISAVLGRACDWGYLDTHPFANRAFKELRQDRTAVVRFLSAEEERRLRAALHEQGERLRALGKGMAGRFADHLEPFILLLRLTGARPAEMRALDWKYVDLLRKQITLIGTTTKTGSTRHVPLSKEAHQILVDWGEQTGTEGLVFENATGEQFKSLNKGFDRARRDAGLKNFRMYDLRHSFASTLVMRGVDLLTVMELLGHSNYSMTLKYSHLAPDHKTRAIKVLDDE